MIVDTIENTMLYENISPRLKAALEYMRSTNLEEMEPGKYNLDGTDITVSIKKGYETKPQCECKWESHCNYIDIQYVFSGRELIGYRPKSELEIKTPYNEERDVMIFHGDGKGTLVSVPEGTFLILFPDDAHMALVQDGAVSTNNKAVFKVRV